MLLPVAALLASSAPIASSSSTVLVLSSRTGPEGTGFVDALRIQMAGTGHVASGPAVRGDNDEEKVARATGEAARSKARVVVWIDRGEIVDGEQEYILHVVGAKGGEWNHEVFRIWARAGPGVDRTLALKVRAVLDRLLEHLDVRPPPPKPQPPPKKDPPLLPTPARRGWALELGARGAVSDGSPRAQGAGLVGIVLAHEVRRRRLELGLSAGYDPGRITLRGASGVMETDELIGEVSSRALYTRGRLGVGAALGARLRIIQATGTDMMGVSVDEVVLVPVVLLGPELRARLTARLHVRIAFSVEMAARRRRLEVNQIKIVDLGRFRGEGLIAVGFSLP